MATSDKFSADWVRRELILAYLSFTLELGDNPKAEEIMRRVVARKADLVLEHMLLTMDIPPGDPVTVCRHIADYQTEGGMAEFQIGKVSDTIMYKDWKGNLLKPMLNTGPSGQVYDFAVAKGLKVVPVPANSLFQAALRKLCNLKAETIPEAELPADVRAYTPKGWVRNSQEGWSRDYWRLSPLR